MTKTIIDYLSEQALKQPQASVIISPLCEDLTYDRLYLHVQTTAAILQSQGIHRQSRIAVIFPSGPELATAIVTILTCAVCVPINPDYSAEEIKASITLLKVDAVILPEGSVHFDVCFKLGLTIFVVYRNPAEPAGLFQLGDLKSEGCIEDLPGLDDIAIIYHTSGTTSVPKVVPLTHRNLCYPIQPYIEHFGLTSRDRTIGPIPLFYTFGVAQMLKMTIAFGGSVVFLPEYSIKTMLAGLKEYKATRFAAGPATLDVVAEYIKKTSLPPEEYFLRFILTGGAAIKPATAAALEAYFKVPVIASYGMSEIGEALAVAPMPPRKRFLESVGVVLHGEMAVMDDNGCILPPGKQGEIAARGPGVFSGYENNEEINKEAFAYGWFHTGDQGYIDTDGYLFITGRLKEIINKGGQKVSPLEVDDRLLRLPGVKEAACFPCPHPNLGEDVAAAVVLDTNALLSAGDIRRMLRATLANFKVPNRIIFVDDIPKNNGKVKRNNLYKLLYECEPEKFGQGRYIAPRNSLESELAEIWQEILHQEKVSVEDDFFALGGDSLQVIILLIEIEERWGKVFPPSVIMEAGNIAGLAAIISADRAVDKLVTIQPEGSMPPIFCIHSIKGDVMIYRNLMPYFGLDQPLYGLRLGAIDSRVKIDIPVLAAEYIQLIRRVRPAGPYRLMGHSFGGIVAYEMAQQLRAAGQIVELLALLDTAIPRFYYMIQVSEGQVASLDAAIPRFYYSLKFKFAERWEYLRTIGLGNYLTIHISRAVNWVRRKFGFSDGTETEVILKSAANKYMPAGYLGDVVMFRAVEELGKYAGYYERCMGWSKYIQGKLHIAEVPGNHVSLLLEPNVGVLANKVKEFLPVNK